MRRGVKKKEYEKLSDSNIQKVCDLLSGEKPITKKEACSILNIKYNTTRLQRIIDEYLQKKENIEKRKSANRGRPASELEIRQAITEYLDGDPISEIAKGLFRSSSFVRGIIERTGVPQRPTSKEARVGVGIIPDSCVADEFRPGEIVWSARHHTTAIIKRELTVEYQETCKGLNTIDYEKKYGAKMYQIYVTEHVDHSRIPEDKDFFPHIDRGGYNATALAYDLGRLSHLEKFGIDLQRI